MIAVCFVVHNQLQYTKWFIESIARNSYPHSLGFFVLDNGSSDGSYEWLNQMQVSPKVVLRNEGNESLSKGWGRVLEAAMKHDPSMICLSNNDLLVGPGWLDAVLQESQKDLKDYWLPNGSISPPHFDEQVKGAPKRNDTVHGRAGWCLFFRPETVREFLPLPEELRLWYGDDYIHWKLAKAGYRGRTILDCYAYHFGSKTIEIVGPVQKIIDQDKETYFKLTGERL